MTRLHGLAALTMVLTAPLPASAQIPQNSPHPRYLVKFICGTMPEGSTLHPGDYKTTVTVYNAGVTKVAIAVSAVVVRDAGSSGATVRATLSSRSQDLKPINPHDLEIFGCERIQQFYPDDVTNPGKKVQSRFGLFVIESDKPLDVTTIHTIGDAEKKIVTGLAFGQVESKRSRSCIKEKEYDLAKIDIWQQVPANKPELMRGRPSYYDNNRTWMNLRRPEDKAYYYQLKFCVCSGDGILEGNVRSGSDSIGTLNQLGFDPKPKWNISDGGGNPSEAMGALVSFSEPITAQGDGSLTVKMSKGGGTAGGISFVGRLRLSDGHIGPCQEN